MDGYQDLAELYKALAHPVRLRILDILAQQEACVCHLTAILDQRQPYVSQQLATLREAGLVTDRRDGTLIYYSPRDEKVIEFLAMGKQALRANGDGDDFPPLPEEPVPGCPCPHCQA
ncbi:MAG: metalloregulator ArsR/SmtB family transcription factor [Anaerolineae bacterium]|jgi:ArsR family transcriptional regulator